MFPRYIHIACALLVTTLVAAQEKPDAREKAGPDGDAPVQVVREKTVYVPYKELEAVFEKAGRGIFLPYEEFLKLWLEAQPKPPDPVVHKPPADAVIRGGLYRGSVTEGKDLARFDVTYNVEALKEGWSELTLPLQNVAVESVEPGKAVFSTKGSGYALLLPDKGNYEVKLTFSARVATDLSKKTLQIGIPPVAVSRLELFIPEDNPNVEVQPRMATDITPVEKGTRLLAYVGNATAVTVSWTPPAGTVEVSDPVFYAEQSVRAYLGERIVRIDSELNFQVVRGELKEFQVELPAEARLLSVDEENVREWQTKNNVLDVRLHSPVKKSYVLKLSFERILDDTPETLKLSLPEVEKESVLRQPGWLAVAGDPGLKLRVVSATGLSQLDRDELPQRLRGDLRVGFRFLAPPPPLELALERIVPLVRSQTTSVVTLGNEDDVWVGFIDYTISRAGLFRLEFLVPKRWSPDEIGDAATVENYQFTDGAELRTITVNLKSRALGGFRLPFRLTAPGSATNTKLTIRAPHVVGTEQDRGLLGIAAPRSLELKMSSSSGVRSTDARELSQSGIMGRVGENTGPPLAYTYHEHSSEQPATVELEIAVKKAEINVVAQHLVEVADDEITITHFLDYEILYKEQERLRISVPSAMDENLKIKSRDVTQQTPIDQGSTTGRTLWELMLQAPTVGNVSLVIEHRLPVKKLAAGKPEVVPIPLVQPAGDTNRRRGYVSVLRHPSGTLEIKAVSKELEQFEPSRLPANVRRGKVHTALYYADVEQEPELSLELTRYEYEPLATTVVNLMHLHSLLSPEPRQLRTQATLFAQNVASRQYLELELPPESSLIELAVNGKREERWRKEASSTLVPFPPAARGLVQVVLVYDQKLGNAMGTLGSIVLETPRVVEKPQDPVPVQKIEVDLYLPPDYTYISFAGELKRDAQDVPSLYTTWMGPFKTPEGTASRPVAAAQGIGIRLQTEGLLGYHFEALAPRAELSFSYSTKEFFVFVKLIAFLVVLFGGLLLVRRTRLERTWVTLGAVCLPLLIAWFQSDAMVGVFTWATAGGVVLALAFVVPWLRDRYHGWQQARLESRLALAEDPYLEGAQTPPPEPPDAAEPPAPAKDAVTEEKKEEETPAAKKPAKARSKKSKASPQGRPPKAEK